MRDVLALETASIAVLRGDGKNEMFLGGQHSLSAWHSMKLNSGDQ